MAERISLKRLLVATDFSHHADFAIKRALQLATTREAEVDIVHIIEEGLPAAAEDDQRATSERNVQELLAKISATDKVSVTIDIVSGLPELDIVERAISFGADCILLGLRERILAENLAIEGTLAETIILRSKLPVLLVKSEPKGPYRSAVVGVDLSTLSEAAIRAAALIAPQAKLHFVHAYGEDETAKTEDLEAFVAREKRLLTEAAAEAGLPAISINVVRKQGRALDVLAEELEATGAELVVLSTHGRTGWARAIMGSVTTDVIDRRLCDVLVIRPE
jgi:nucleotide-binding universal stress UspA family protein